LLDDFSRMGAVVATESLNKPQRIEPDFGDPLLGLPEPSLC
jgi:hypothetical protein